MDAQIPVKTGTHPATHTAVCDCGETVTAVPHAVLNDWQWVGSDGLTLAAFEPIPWEELKAHDIATYSRLSAASHLGCLAACHVHRPAQSEPYAGDVPRCCDEPMRLAPSGWVCRTSKHLVIEAAR